MNFTATKYVTFPDTVMKTDTLLQNMFRLLPINGHYINTRSAEINTHLKRNKKEEGLSNMSPLTSCCSRWLLGSPVVYCQPWMWLVNGEEWSREIFPGCPIAHASSKAHFSKNKILNHFSNWDSTVQQLRYHSFSTFFLLRNFLLHINLWLHGIRITFTYELGLQIKDWDKIKHYFRNIWFYILWK